MDQRGLPTAQENKLHDIPLVNSKHCQNELIDAAKLISRANDGNTNDILSKGKYPEVDRQPLDGEIILLLGSRVGAVQTIKIVAHLEVDDALNDNVYCRLDENRKQI